MIRFQSATNLVVYNAREMNKIVDLMGTWGNICFGIRKLIFLFLGKQKIHFSKVAPHETNIPSLH